MALTKSDYSSMMKTHYLGPMRDLLNNASLFMSRMERYTEPTGGNQLHIPIRTGRTPSIGARPDSTAATLPLGATPVYGNATYGLTHQYATVRITGPVIRASRADNFAFARAQVRDMEDTAKDFKKDLNRQVFGDGGAYLCKVVSGSDSGTTITVTVDSDLYPTNPTKFLYVGEVLDVVTFDDYAKVTNGDSITITSVPSTSTFTYTAGTSFTEVGTTQAIIREDSSNATDYSLEMNGLVSVVDNEDPDAIVDDSSIVLSNIGGLDRASTTQWQGNVLHNSGVVRPYSVNLIEQGIDEVDIQSGQEVSLLQTNHPIFRVYGSLLAAAKTVDMAKMELDGGWKALDLNGIPMVRDVECPDYTLFCLDESSFMLGVTGDYEWIEDDGGGVLTRLPRQDQYEGVLNRDMQLMCDNPRSNCKIEDIAHS